MMTYSKSTKRSAEKTVRDIRRATRRNYSAEECTSSEPFGQIGLYSKRVSRPSI